MIKDGKKWACESCVRGHRVSNCTHDDRPLTMIKPKGRPVKQCEHCRSSRKSKSHHGKCDCGSKKEKKDKTESKPIIDSDCCCHRGDKCVCGSKGDNQAVRMERSLKRSSTAPTVKSKPLVKSQSDAKLTVVTNGHHKPAHRNNNAAHTSGAPYPSRARPHTLMGPSAFATSPEDMDILNILSNGRSADDLFVPASSSISSYRSSSDMFSTSSSRPFSLSNSRSNSTESFDENFQSLDFDLMSGSIDLNEMNGNSFGDNWFDTVSPTSPQFSTSANNLQQYVTSPNFVDDYSCRSAPSELADIPEFGQYPSSTTSNGRESSRSPPTLDTPVQAAVDHHRHVQQSYILEQLSDSNNSLERWSSSGTSDLDMLNSAIENTRYGHARNLSESSTDSGFTPTVMESMVANEAQTLEMGMSLQLDLSTISPEYMDLARRYDWL